jgi:hypothetical protein
MANERSVISVLYDLAALYFQTRTLNLSNKYLVLGPTEDKQSSLLIEYNIQHSPRTKLLCIKKSHELVAALSIILRAATGSFNVYSLSVLNTRIEFLDSLML